MIELHIGFQGTGTVTMAGGTLSSAITLAEQPGSSGALSVSSGTVLTPSLTLGRVACDSSAAATLSGGAIYVTNSGHNATLNVLGGTFTQNGGTLAVDVLILTNACGHLIRSGGSLLYHQLVLDPNLTALGDGIPNWWKQR